MRKGLWLLFFLFATPGLATVLEDPNGEGRWLQRYFPQTTAAPFTCERPVSFSVTNLKLNIICHTEPEHCELQYSPTLIKSFNIRALNCDQPEVDLKFDFGLEMKIPAQSDSRFGQTWIQEFLAASNYFIEPSGTWEIEKVLFPEKHILVDEAGDEQEIESVPVHLTYKQKGVNQQNPFLILLDLNQRGLDQIIYFGQSYPRDQYFLKKKGLIP